MRIVSTVISVVTLTLFGFSETAMLADPIQIESAPAIAIKASTEEGKHYVLEATGNLTNPAWKPVSLPYAGDGVLKTLLKLRKTESEYYRIAQYDLTAGLVAYYPMNGNVNDFSGNNNHGTLLGAVGTEDRFGNASSAFSFNGVNQYISIPSSSAFNPGSGDFSISHWVKFGALNQNSHIIGKSDGQSFANKWIVLYQNNPSSFTFHMNSTDGTANSQTGTAPWSYVSNSWVHIVITKSGSTYRTFLDGNIITEATGKAIVPTTTLPLTIGVTEGINWFQGAVDELRFYNRTLSPIEVKALFYQSAVNVNAGLVGYYPFDGDLTDHSVYGNTAINNNAVFSTDRFGRANHAIYFDGTSTVTAPNQTQFDEMNLEMTVAAWVQFDTAPRQIHIIGRSEGQFEHKKWILFYNNDPQNFSFLAHNPPTSTFGGKVNWVYSTNNWYHLAGVKSGSTYSTYINGVKVAVSSGPALLPAISADIKIGGAEGNATAPPAVLQFKGKLDDVRFYKRALSSSELKALAETVD